MDGGAPEFRGATNDTDRGGMQQMEINVRAGFTDGLAHTSAGDQTTNNTGSHPACHRSGACCNALFPSGWSAIF